MRKRKTTSGRKVEKPGLVFGTPEWSGGERSEPKRNGGVPKTSPKSAAIGDFVKPDPEVVEKPQRRRFSASYKAEIVRKADASTESGQIGALLRREGLYSSQLTEWRKQYRQGALTALKDNKRGRRKTNPLQEENEKLRRQAARLEHRLQQAETIIEAQKKISEILGNPRKSNEYQEDD